MCLVFGCIDPPPPPKLKALPPKGERGGGAEAPEKFMHLEKFPHLRSASHSASARQQRCVDAARGGDPAGPRLSPPLHSTPSSRPAMIGRPVTVGQGTDIDGECECAPFPEKNFL